MSLSQPNKKFPTDLPLSVALLLDLQMVILILGIADVLNTSKCMSASIAYFPEAL